MGKQVKYNSQTLKELVLDIQVWKLTNILTTLYTKWHTQTLILAQVFSKHVWTNRPWILRALWNIKLRCWRIQKQKLNIYLKMSEIF